MNNATQAGTTGSMDIPAPGFFHMLRPWKKGTLVTVDGQARFAELSFIGESGIRIKPLVDFPRVSIDNALVASTEAQLVMSRTNNMFHIADTATGKTTMLGPNLEPRFFATSPTILDPPEKIILFSYMDDSDRNQYREHFFIYDHKSGAMLFESSRENTNSLLFAFTPELVFCENVENGKKDMFLYNWKTQTIVRNELTQKLVSLQYLSCDIGPGRDWDLDRRVLFVTLRSPDWLEIRGKLKITWDEKYEHVQVIPLDYLVPDKKNYLGNFFLSEDGQWATSFVGGYRGIYGEDLYKRVFFHLDGRYPNGISMPVFVDSYDEWRPEWGSFVEHPVYGWCFVEKKNREDEKIYLRLYRMDDVLAEINRRLLEKAEDIVGQ